MTSASFPCWRVIGRREWQCQQRTPSGGARRLDQGARQPQAVARWWTAAGLQQLLCTTRPHPTFSSNAPAIFPLAMCLWGLFRIWLWSTGQERKDKYHGLISNFPDCQPPPTKTSHAHENPQDRNDSCLTRGEGSRKVHRSSVMPRWWWKASLIEHVVHTKLVVYIYVYIHIYVKPSLCFYSPFYREMVPIWWWKVSFIDHLLDTKFFLFVCFYYQAYAFILHFTNKDTNSDH